MDIYTICFLICLCISVYSIVTAIASSFKHRIKITVEKKQLDTNTHIVESEDDSAFDLIFDSPVSTKKVITSFKKHLENPANRDINGLFYLSFIMENKSIEDRLAIGLNKKTLKFIFDERSDCKDPEKSSNAYNSIKYEPTKQLEND